MPPSGTSGITVFEGGAQGGRALRAERTGSYVSTQGRPTIRTAPKERLEMALFLSDGEATP
jgi:hypothetical protein